jgi:hypothetical protein
LSEPKWEKVEDCLAYFAARADYMKYDEYLAAGYPIGSGVVEGACRHLVKDRMEQTGMRWRIAGAQAILSLRAIYVNDDWDAFHADRILTRLLQQTGFFRRKSLFDGRKTVSVSFSWCHRA